MSQAQNAVTYQYERAIVMLLSLSLQQNVKERQLKERSPCVFLPNLFI